MKLLEKLLRIVFLSHWFIYNTAYALNDDKWEFLITSAILLCVAVLPWSKLYTEKEQIEIINTKPGDDIIENSIDINKYETN